MSASTGTTVFSVSALLRAVWPINTAKMAARAAGRSYRTVEDWLSDRCCPSAETLVRMARENAALRAELIQILEGDPREVSSVDRRVAPIGASGAAGSFGGCPTIPAVTAR